jgi:hypothetical protein
MGASRVDVVVAVVLVVDVISDADISDCDEGAVGCSKDNEVWDDDEDDEDDDDDDEETDKDDDDDDDDDDDKDDDDDVGDAIEADNGIRPPPDVVEDAYCNSDCGRMVSLLPPTTLFCGFDIAALSLSL